ncbi:MAG: MFS transporter [Pirellulales bacterium]|nr:MFS transporter [Pirellulales bacterium]
MKPTRVRYGVMAFLCALSFLTYYDRVCIMRAQQDIQKDLDLSDPDMGKVLGAFFLAYALFEMPSGWLGDRYGARGTLTRIVLAWSFFTVMTGAATGFGMLYLARFLFGVGEAGAFPNMARVQGRWLPLAERGRAGGLLWLSARWGGAFSPLIFGSLLALFDSRWFRGLLAMASPGFQEIPSWRLGFSVAGLFGVIWCVLFYLWFRDDPADKPSVNAAELTLIRPDSAAVEHLSHHAPKIWRPLVRSRSLWALAIYYICGSIGWSFFITWLPRFLKDVHKVDFNQSELASGLPLFCGGIACLAGGIVSDRLVRWTGRIYFGRAICPIGGTLTAAAAMLLVPKASSVPQAVALMCLASAAFDFGQAANWATMVDIGGKHAGTSTGFINMVGNLSGAIAPWLAAEIFDGLGWPTLFTVYAAMFIAAGAMWMLIDPKKRFYEDATDESRK